MISATTPEEPSESKQNMKRQDLYRERAVAEVSTWIDPTRDGDLSDKFWYVESARRDAEGAWQVVLGEEQLFYSAARLSVSDEETRSDKSADLPATGQDSFEDLRQRCQIVLDEVKRVITRYFSSSGCGTVKNWRISVGEDMYRILTGDRFKAWEQDPRRFLAEYTLIESHLRDTTSEPEKIVSRKVAKPTRSRRKKRASS